MLQDSSSMTWDLRDMNPGLSTSLRFYVLFLFVVWIIACIKLARVWRAALPFRLSRQAQNPNYVEFLQASATSLKQWIGCTFLGWGLFASVRLYNVCNRLLDDKMAGRFVVVYLVREFSTALTMALIVVIFVFLARWHIINRIEHLHKS